VFKLPRPARFILIRCASEERIEAHYSPDGSRMTGLVVYTRSK